jgi:hypothetical protein
MMIMLINVDMAIGNLKLIKYLWDVNIIGSQSYPQG